MSGEEAETDFKPQMVKEQKVARANNFRSHCFTQHLYENCKNSWLAMYLEIYLTKMFITALFIVSKKI